MPSSDRFAGLKRLYYGMQRRQFNLLLSLGFSEDHFLLKRDYRTYVGPKEAYYNMGPRVLSLLLDLGLREEHHFLDIGCGSLRNGRLLIPFLLPRRYCGVEPQSGYMNDGLEHEIKSRFGEKLVEYKHPRFDDNADFEFELFDTRFDFVIAISVFIHCGESQFRECLKNLHRVIHPGTRIVMSLNVGEESRESAKQGRLYSGATHVAVQYSLKDIERLTREEGYLAKNLELADTGKETGFFLLTPMERSGETASAPG